MQNDVQRREEEIGLCGAIWHSSF